MRRGLAIALLMSAIAAPAAAQQPSLAPQEVHESGQAVYSDDDFCRLLRVPEPDVAHCAGRLAGQADIFTASILPRSLVDGAQALAQAYVDAIQKGLGASED